MSLENTREIENMKVLMVRGQDGQDGTVVVANPSGSATDDLLKVKIGNTIYAITGSGGGQAQNARYAKVSSVSNEVITTTVVKTLATGDTLQDYDILFLKNEGAPIIPTSGLTINLYTDSSNYVAFGIVDSNSNYWLHTIPSNATLVLRLMPSSGTTTHPCYVLGCMTDDGYVRSGQRSGSTLGNNATAEGTGTRADGDDSHAEGNSAFALGDYSHAEGTGSTAYTEGSHAEGNGTVAGVSGATGKGFGHAEGYSTTASGRASHAEGYSTTASGNEAHAEGYHTTASGAESHASGYYTTAGYDDQTVVGKYNDNKATTLFEVGNGTGSNAKSNALEVYANGNLVAGGTISDADGQLLHVTANTGTPAIGLDKLKIGNTAYNINTIPQYTASSASSNQLTVGVTNISDCADKVIAVNTGSAAGTTSSGWSLYLFDGQAPLPAIPMYKADGTTRYAEAVTANQLLLVYYDSGNDKAIVLDVAGASSGGSGNTISKTRYTVTYTSWSASANAAGYYTYSITLSPTLNTSYPPNVYISGAGDSTFPTDSEKTQYGYLEECNLSASNTLVLYAKTKPTSTFYVYVEGVNA